KDHHIVAVSEPGGAGIRRGSPVWCGKREQSIGFCSGMWFRFACAMVALTSFFALPAVAQTYPSKLIRFIVPFPPGGRTGSRRGGCIWGGDGARPSGLWQGILHRIAIAMVALTSFFALPAVAQTYPSKLILFIVPF